MVVLQAWAAIFGRPGSVDLRLANGLHRDPMTKSPCLTYQKGVVCSTQVVTEIINLSDILACGSRLPWS
jgi:hypothetical protein